MRGDWPRHHFISLQQGYEAVESRGYCRAAGMVTIQAITILPASPQRTAETRRAAPTRRSLR